MPSSDKDDASNRGRISPQDRAEIRGRSDDLDRRLRDAQGKPDYQARNGNGGSARSDTGKSGRDAMGHALRTSTEMVAGVIVGSAIGWALDQWLGTWPAFFIVFFLLGSAAGMTNVIRSGLKMKTGPSDPSKGPAVQDDDDDN